MKNNNHLSRSAVNITFAVFILAPFFFFSCQEKKKDLSQLHSLSLFVSTVSKLNEVVLENNFPPVVASRNYAYSTIAAYEVLALMQPEKYNSLSTQIQGFPQIPTPSEEAKKMTDYPLSSLLALVIVGNQVTFPEGSMMQEYDKIKELAKQSGLSKLEIDSSESLAKKVAGIVLAWSKQDKYAALRSAPKYTLTDDPSRWVPTPSMYAQALEPHLKEIRPFTLLSSDQFKPIPPPAFDLKHKNSTYYKELMEVKEVGEKLTDEQKEIASFWNDNPFELHVEGHVMIGEKKFSPAGHWTNIIGLLALQNKTSLDDAMAIYAHSCIALFDAFISCWDEKYRSNRVRPETIINAHFSNTWKPFLQTPPFPAYTSGHSVISSAVAEVLSSYYNDMPFTDSTQRVVGLPVRSFASIRAAAQEASISRLYGGIHYRSDLENGLVQGANVGKWVVDKVHLIK